MVKVLEGKVALVTGASRGLGRTIARMLAVSGALVAINYAANEGAARETLKMIEGDGGRGFLIQAALGEPEAAKALARQLEAELTRRTGQPDLDILVNNVGGITGPGGTAFANIMNATPEAYHRIFADNLGSTFFVTQALLPRLRNNGRVINISSTGARLALNRLVVYSMAKAGVETFTRAMAKELGPRGITVNAVAPSFVATDASAEDLKKPETLKAAAALTALGRPFGTTEEIAGVVHALATPSLGWVTGQIIEASGGFRI